jgi:hypothetical protein
LYRRDAIPDLIELFGRVTSIYIIISEFISELKISNLFYLLIIR